MIALSLVIRLAVHSPSTSSWVKARMDKVDLKSERADLYSPPRGRFVEVMVPPMDFLAVTGNGDPNTSEAYRHAVEALFALSYAAKFLSKKELVRDYVVLPLEGLWCAADAPRCW